MEWTVSDCGVIRSGWTEAWNREEDVIEQNVIGDTEFVT
jgi:hypothetical protein